MADRANASKEEKDGEQGLAKQLGTYADSFTAFSFAQGAAFCFLLGQNTTFACVLWAKWGSAEACLALAGAGYLLLLYLCHSREDRLIPLGSRGEKIGRIVRTIRCVRFCIVGVATLGEMIIVIVTHCARPLFDCSKVLLLPKQGGP